MDNDDRTRFKQVIKYAGWTLAFVITITVVVVIFWITSAVKGTPKAPQACVSHDPTQTSTWNGVACVVDNKPEGAVCTDVCLVDDVGVVAWDTNNSRLYCNGVPEGRAESYDLCPIISWVTPIADLTPYNYTAVIAGICTYGLTMNVTTYASDLETLVALAGTPFGQGFCMGFMANSFALKPCFTAKLTTAESGLILCTYIFKGTDIDTNPFWESLGYEPEAPEVQRMLPRNQRLDSAINRRFGLVQSPRRMQAGNKVKAH